MQVLHTHIFPSLLHLYIHVPADLALHHENVHLLTNSILCGGRIALPKTASLLKSLLSVSLRNSLQANLAAWCEVSFSDIDIAKLEFTYK